MAAKTIELIFLKEIRAMPSTHGGHCPFPYAVIILVLNLLHHGCTVFEAYLVCSSHFSGGSIAHAVKYAVYSIKAVEHTAQYSMLRNRAKR